MGYDFKCDLCSWIIQHGKTLSCQHIFCHDCIENNHINQSSRDKLLCPIMYCRQVTNLPSMTIDDLDDFKESDRVKSVSPSETPMYTVGQGRVLFRTGRSYSVDDQWEATEVTTRPPGNITRALNVNAPSAEHQQRQHPSATMQAGFPFRQQSYKSTLQTPEQIAALKRKRAQLNRQMSMPDQTQPFMVNNNVTESEDCARRRLERSESTVSAVSRSEERPILRRFKSVISTENERNALRKYAEKLQRQPSLEAECMRGVPPAKTQAKGFTTRNSRRQKEKSTSGGILTSGMNALLLSAKKCESEFRSRREGPWGYCEYDHWDGRSWGEAEI